MNNDDLKKLREISKKIDSNQLSIYSGKNSNYPEVIYKQQRGSLESMSDSIAKRKDEEEARSKRILEINEEKLELDKFKIFLLQSVNRDQKEMLEKFDSLIDTNLLVSKTEEANLVIIQEELSNLKISSDNLNASFIKLIKNKLAEKGVETAISYLLIGLKTLFLN